MKKKPVREGWELLVRVELDRSRRVQCQCRGCGRTVYADVHLIRWPDGEIACWGSGCFAREMGIAQKNMQATYNRVNGWRLTAEERDLLDANREALIARIKGLEEAILQAEMRRAQAHKAIQTASRAKPVNPPDLPRNYNERSHKFTVIFRDQTDKILKQVYRGDEQFCRRFIAQEGKTYPIGTKAEIIVTRTGQSIYQWLKV